MTWQKNKISDKGVPEAPIDGQAYTRKNGGWQVVGGEVKEAETADYIDAVVDANNRVIEGTKKDGTKYIHKLESPSINSINTEIENISESVNEVEQKVDSIDGFQVVDTNDYIDAVVDAENRVIEGTKKDGTKYIRKIQSKTLVTENIEYNNKPDYNSAETADYIDAVVDANKRVIHGIKKDGTFFVQKLDAANINISKLKGKKWVVIGDSFTNGSAESLGTLDDGIYAGKQACYPYIIGNRTGVEVIKFFEGGRTLAFPSIPGAFTNSITNPNSEFYYQNIPVDADYITIYLGTNDFSHSRGTSPDQEVTEGQIPLGSATDSNATTFYGAWNVVLGWLRVNRPFAHVGILISNGYTGIESIDPVSNCLPWVTAQIEMAKKYGYPYLNLNGDERTPAMIRCINSNIPLSVRNIIIEQQAVDLTSTPPNQHPNKFAHEFESHFIENFLLTI